jgi:hypothetical protein
VISVIRVFGFDARSPNPSGLGEAFVGFHRHDLLERDICLFSTFIGFLGLDVVSCV